MLKKAANATTNVQCGCTPIETFPTPLNTHFAQLVFVDRSRCVLPRVCCVCIAVSTQHAFRRHRTRAAFTGGRRRHTQCGAAVPPHCVCCVFLLPPLTLWSCALCPCVQSAVTSRWTQTMTPPTRRRRRCWSRSAHSSAGTAARSAAPCVWFSSVAAVACVLRPLLPCAVRLLRGRRHSHTRRTAAANVPVHSPLYHHPPPACGSCVLLAAGVKHPCLWRCYCVGMCRY